MHNRVRQFRQSAVSGRGFVAEWEYFDLMCMVAVVCKAMVFAE